MWIANKIDNLIEILGTYEYTKVEIETHGDVAAKIVLDFPKFKYTKSKRQIKFYNSKETVIINIWASSDIIIDKQNLKYQIMLEYDERVTLKMYLK